MATVHLARLLGAEGFSRIVAAKRLHPQYTASKEFVTMFLDEARISSKIRHPNVVPVLDVVIAGEEVILIQEYVHGVGLDKLVRAACEQGLAVPIPIAIAMAADALAGLHAAHEAKDELGQALNIIHRDVSPQNIMVSTQGVARLLDFGVAKASLCMHETREGVLKGKIGYMAPEQFRGEVSRESDIYSMGVVLWECLVGKRMHGGKSEAQTFASLMNGEIEPMSRAMRSSLATPERIRELTALDAVVMKSLSLNSDERFETAAAMQEALLAVRKRATATEVAQWVECVGAEYLANRNKIIGTEETGWRRRMGEVTRPSARMDDVDSIVESTHSRNAESARAVALSELPAALRPRRKFWIGAAAITMFAMLFVVVARLASRPPAPAAAAPPEAQTGAAEQETAAIPAPPAPTVASSPAPEPSSSASASPSAKASSSPKTVRVQHHTVAAPRAPAPPPPPPATQATSSPTSAPAAAPTPAPNADCDPPFYFEGKKKIFKSGCL
jgi:serine/threonine-protein kinase